MKLLRTILFGLLLGGFLTPPFASAQSPGQTAKPTDYDYKSLALTSVRDSAKEAKKLTNIGYKVRFLVASSALLSASNKKEATELLDKALTDLKEWEAETNAPLSRRFMAADLRNQVLAQYLKIDTDRANKLIAQDKPTQSDPDSKPLKNDTSWNKNLLERQSNADRTMTVALTILESDPERATSLLVESVQHGIVPFKLMEAFQKLRANKPRLLEAQERIATSLRSTVALDNYSVTAASLLSWDADMLPQVRATFTQFLLRSLEAFVDLSHIATREGGLESGYMDSMFATFATYARPAIAQHNPDELGRVDLLLEQVAPQVSEQIRDMIKSNAVVEPEDPRDRLTEIKRETNPLKRDSRLLSLVVDLLSKDDWHDQESLLQEAVQVVTNDELKTTLGDFVSLTRVAQLTKAQRFDDAAKAAVRVTNLDLRAWALLSLSSVAFANDTYFAMTLVNAAMKALEVSPATPRKVEITLLAATLTAQRDPNRSLEIVSLIPKYANAVEEPTESKRSFASGIHFPVTIGTFKIMPANPPEELNDVQFDPAIRRLAKRDWFGLQKIAESLKDPVFGLTFKLELANGMLLESSNRATSTATPIQP